MNYKKELIKNILPFRLSDASDGKSIESYVKEEQL